MDASARALLDLGEQRIALGVCELVQHHLSGNPAQLGFVDAGSQPIVAIFVSGPNEYCNKQYDYETSAKIVRRSFLNCF